MAYEMETIQLSQEIFYYLLEHRELREEEEPAYYKAYTEEQEVQSLIKSQGNAAQCNIERYDNVVYLIPKEDNKFLGYSKADLKTAICKSGATDKDYYLAQFVILTILVEFYDGQGNSAKAREYMRVGELQNKLSENLKAGREQVEEDEEDQLGIAYRNMAEAYEALRSEDRGSRARTTKEGFLYHILNFLQKQGLIEYVEEDEMIKTTKKLDNFMDWNLLNQNHFARVARVLTKTAKIADSSEPKSSEERGLE